jgi:hypothetical protein
MKALDFECYKTGFKNLYKIRPVEMHGTERLLV